MLSRRNFLKTAFAATVAVGLTPRIPWAEPIMPLIRTDREELEWVNYIVKTRILPKYQAGIIGPGQAKANLLTYARTIDRADLIKYEALYKPLSH